MIPRGDGRFCEVCRQCVIDFSTKTDREIIEVFRNSKEKICGQFREDQLNRNLILPNQARISGWRLFALTFGALFATDFVQAQTTKPKNTTTKHYASAKPSPQNCRFLIVKGTVKSRTGEPLQKTFIGLKNRQGILAITDSLGNFRFKLPENWISNSKNKRIVLTFSRADYYLFEQPVSTLKDHTFAITLDALPAELKKEETAVEVIKQEPEIIRLRMGFGSPTDQLTAYPKESNYYKMKHDLKD